MISRAPGTGERPRVLILIGAMWPGNDSSGPNRSVQGLCEALSDRFDFRLLARSGAEDDAPPSPGWIDRGFAQIRYLRMGRFGADGLIGAVRCERVDALLMNSVWDREFTLPVLAARRAGVLPLHPAIISTRGEFSREALALKPVRKRAMRQVLQASGALSRITLHATSEIERRDVERAFPRVPTMVAANVRPLPVALPRQPERGDALRAVFIGRISPVKGLDLALRALARTERRIDFQVFGPEEDRGYVERCRDLAAALPDRVNVIWQGAASADAIPRILSDSDLLLMPSHSENFGHAIFEALAAGVPVLVGPNTPWQNLVEREAGAVLALGDIDGWARAIDMFADRFPRDRDRYAASARRVAQDYVERDSAAERWAAALEALAAMRSPV